MSFDQVMSARAAPAIGSYAGISLRAVASQRNLDQCHGYVHDTTIGIAPSHPTATFDSKRINTPNARLMSQSKEKPHVSTA